jgi:hypothetical protein
MASRFQSRFQDIAVPRLFVQFGHSVDLISADDATEYRIDAMVSMDPVGTEEGFSDVQGNVTVKTADFARCVETIASASKCRHKGQIFDVYGEASEHCGLTVFNIRRKYSEQANTNIYDLHGNQIPFSE